MKVIRIHATGGTEVLKYEEIRDPKPKEGEALVKIEATGLNFIEIYFRTGIYKAPLPLILGTEAAGTVVEVGDGVSDVKVGDRVATTNASGSYAELASVPVQRLVPLPAHVTTRQAAAAMLQGMTAHYLATSTFPLRAGQTCLVHAAAGGVGLLLCQIAKARGARVIGTVSSEEKAQLALAAGASDVILYTRQDFVAETKRLTDGKGVSVVFDSVGKTTFEKGLDTLSPRGMMALYGQSSGPVAPLDIQLLNQKGSLFLTRPTLGHYIATREELLQRSGDILKWMAEGKLQVKVDRELPLPQAAEAHRLLEGRGTSGKVLLIPDA